MFCPSSARGLEFFWKTILLSSSARGSKPISDTSILLRPRFEADLLIYWFAHLTGLILDCQSNLVLFRSYTWKPIKFGSVPVLHLKTSQTCNSNFVICLLTWTYPSLPVWLRFWLCHACLLNWTYNSDANFIFFIHLDLPPGASSFHHLFIYLDLPPSARQRGFKSSSVGIWALF